ncbi:MAG: hypothetical protein GY722_29755, partial [bacterium]|nr:hypothetical protein [bacterium]
AILGIIKELPDLLATTGKGIAKAGESAVAASSFLLGTDDDDGAVSDITEFAAAALARCVEQLDNAVGTMNRAGEEIDKVVTGLDFGTAPLVGGVSDRMRDGAGNLAVIAEDFGVVADQLKRLGVRLNDTGGDLNNLGGLLKDTGTTLTSLAAMGG